MLSNNTSVRAPRVAIVGAGMSGLLAGVMLKKRGNSTFSIYEKANDVGGTWRDNRYPGLACDVPAHAYTYSFARNPGWHHRYAKGAEINDYFKRVARDHDLERHVVRNKEITRARHDGTEWILEARDGSIHHHDVLITACGVLHHPSYPDIEGLSSFAGPCFHTARWDSSVDLHGKTIAVVGTSSTGTQVVSALATTPCRLKVFQRSAQWIFPIPNRSYREWERRLMKRFPWLNEALALYYEKSLENLLGNSVIRDGWQRRFVNAMVRWNLGTVKDPQLRRKLTPQDRPLCRRIVMSGDYYRALQRDNVELIVDRIARVVPEGIVDDAGALHRVDVIVLATGYKTLEYMRPMEIVGAAGRTLSQYWQDGPRAYKSVMIPGLPNFFMLSGPHCPYGNFSAITQTEIEVEYILKCVDLLVSGKARRVMPTDAATERFNSWVKDAARNTIWVSGCRSWYLSDEGLPMNWPGTPAQFRSALRAPEIKDLDLA
jgi:cation diffusion facilitator CzcD-associated flavoprotein CzcO